MDTSKIIITFVALIALSVGGVSLYEINSVSQQYGGILSRQAPYIIPATQTSNLVTYDQSSGLNQASSTVCALKSPSATSTLVFASVQFTTGTSSTVDVDLAKDNTFAATSTLLGTTYLMASGQDTILASTSPASGNAVRFAPNQYFTVKYGGATSMTNNVFVGTCKAEWMVN